MARTLTPSGLTTQIILLILILLIAGAGVATAAVSGNFSSSYDGYNDDTDTDIRGHEIQISGTLEFSGENAVNPRIIIRSSQHTILDDGSVELLQPGGSAINFNKQYTESGVRYTADEIPSGTQIELNYVVYPITGLTQSEVRSAQVIIRYETPSGATEQNQIDVTTSLSNTPPQVLSSQQQSEQMNLAILGFAVVGGLTVLLIVVMALYSGVKKILGTSGPGGGGPPGN
jgi:hypothetical protein